MSHGHAQGTDEFFPDASSWPAGLSRREFLELMGASLALAGLGACNRPPDKTIVPYVVPPERELEDGVLYYATAILTAVAAKAPLGSWTAPISLAIATAKMLLVFLFFMQLWYQRGLVRIFAAAGFFWLALIGVLTFSDYLTRGWLLG